MAYLPTGGFQKFHQSDSRGQAEYHVVPFKQTAFMRAENAMSIRIGYLLPTRERVMAAQPQAASLLELAERAERLGFDSVWAGDSLLARPRH